MDDLSGLIAALPEQPTQALRNWVESKQLDELGGEAIVFRRESVEQDEMDPFYYPPRVRHRRTWGARCDCTACGEEFTAGYGSAAYGSTRVKGIRLLRGDDEQLYPGIPADEGDAVDIAEGDWVCCPYCGASAKLLHASSVRGGRTWRLMIAEIKAIDGRLVLLYWMASRTLDEYGIFCTEILPHEAVILDRCGKLRRIRHNRRNMGGYTQLPHWEETAGFRAPEELRYNSTEAANGTKVGAVVYPAAADLTGTTGEKTGIEDYARQGEWLSEYLLLWRRHKNAENLARRGWAETLDALMEGRCYENVRSGSTRTPEIPEIDWAERKPHRMLRMDRHSFAELAGRWSAETLKLWMRYLDAGGDLTAAEFDGAEKEISSGSVRRMVRRMEQGRTEPELRKLLRYVRRQAARQEQERPIAAGLYLDYLEMLEARQTQPTAYEICPRDLRAAHDRETAAYRERKTSKFAGDFAELAKKYAPLTWSDGEICIRVAAEPDELTREGCVLHHCVGSYHEKHAHETDVIFFVRHARRPERSWYTLDICMTGSEPREVQLHGYRNECCGRKRLRIPPQVREFCDRWKKEVLLPWAAENRQKRRERKTA